MDGISPEEEDKPKKLTDIGVQANVYDKYKVQCELSVFTVWILSVIFGIVSVFIGSYSYLFIYVPRYHVSDQLVDAVGQQGVLIFRQYDRDGDGYLSLHEFEPLANKLANVTVSIT